MTKSVSSMPFVKNVAEVGTAILSIGTAIGADMYIYVYAAQDKDDPDRITGLQVILVLFFLILFILGFYFAYKWNPDSSTENMVGTYKPRDRNIGTYDLTLGNNK